MTNQISDTDDYPSDTDHIGGYLMMCLEDIFFPGQEDPSTLDGIGYNYFPDSGVSEMFISKQALTNLRLKD